MRHGDLCVRPAASILPVHSECNCCHSPNIDQLAIVLLNKHEIHLFIGILSLQIGRTALCKECSRRIQYFDDLKEFGARSSALRNNLAYNIVPEKIQMHHNGKPSNRKKYIRRKIACKCMLCQKEFQSKCYLHKHMKRHQNVKSAYKCMICNSEFLSANSLSAHEKTHPTYK